jgi:menaquinone-9 beta-reductase
MTFSNNFDVVIVGAGVGGGALATRLARDGLSILVLERTLAHVDRIRGEYLAPWGVAETRQLGVLDDLLAAGGHYNTKAMRYGDGVPVEVARATPLDISALIPGVPGALALGHPRICDTLNATARAAAATLLRGVTDVTVIAGSPPTIAFDHEGVRHTLRPRLVVGADGRGSTIGRQIGVKVQTEPVHHLIAGLLVEGVPEWPDDELTAGVHGGVHQLIFPQGDGRLRLYLCYPLGQRGRFSGPQAATNFLEAFRVPTLPHSDAIAAGTIAGPCLGYPNADNWIDEPYAPGVVLIGDAAGHNDPTIGQGLSLTMCDARLISEGLSDGWDDSKSVAYATERRERMRRMRITARLMSILRCEFGPDADQTRADAFARMAKSRRVGVPTLATLVGPYGIPEEAFGEPAIRALLGENWSLSAEGDFVRPGTA